MTIEQALKAQLATIQVLKTRFPNLTAEEVSILAAEIVTKVAAVTQA